MSRFHSPSLDQLCRELANLSPALDAEGAWPASQLELCARHGVTHWFVPETWGGTAWSEADQLAGYVELAAACLTTAFVLTQRSGACQRIAASGNAAAHETWLPGLADGSLFATVGISHLTTSRRHLANPVLHARLAGPDLVLNGQSPWVTGAAQAQVTVTGATLDDGRQVLAAVPTDLPGILIDPPARLLALSASHTAAVHFREVRVSSRNLLAGPVENVLRAAAAAGTGGLTTSALALGLARSALGFLGTEAGLRPDLAVPAAGLRSEWEACRQALAAAAAGQLDCSTDELRAQANSLVLRATQAALSAAKGTGFVIPHPASRWCREALFFLVWSCPQGVTAANLCEWAGL